MSYFPLGHRFTAGEIDDFDDCDPAHFAGGYDIDLTYGRSLPPSYETCYPYRSSASDHTQFAYHSKPSACAVEALGNEYNSYPRPWNPASADECVYGGPEPNHGFQPGGGVSDHGGRHEYARPKPGYGSGYRMNPPSSEFGSSHGRSSEYENPSLMHHQPRGKPDYDEFGYARGVRKPVSGFGGSRHEPGGSGYIDSPEKPSYPMPSYPEHSYPIPSYPEPTYPIPSYPERSFPIPSYPEPSYPTPGYGPQKYERDNSDHGEGKHHHPHGPGHHYRSK